MGGHPSLWIHVLWHVKSYKVEPSPHQPVQESGKSSTICFSYPVVLGTASFGNRWLWIFLSWGATMWLKTWCFLPMEKHLAVPSNKTELEKSIAIKTCDSIQHPTIPCPRNESHHFAFRKLRLLQGPSLSQPTGLVWVPQLHRSSPQPPPQDITLRL